MEDYSKFLQSKKKSFIESGFEVDVNYLNKHLLIFKNMRALFGMISTTPEHYNIDQVVMGMMKNIFVRCN